jgi:predicted transcriptional regulator
MKERRNRLTIQYHIIEAIFRGARIRAEIAHKANINNSNVTKALLQSLEEQGFIVSVDMGYLKEIGHKNGHQLHYAVTDKAKLWRLVMERAEELAPK